MRPWGIGRYLAALAATLLLAVPPLAAAGRSVTFRTPDGRTVAALMLDARDRPAPAVVLVPMLGRSKDDWDAVASQLAEANISVLSIDLPGTTLPADPGELAGWQQAVAGAVAYLAARPADVNPALIGIAGASLGANLAILAAAANPSVRSLALVSPSLDYRGVRVEGAMTQYGARPALLIASLQDPYAARTARTLAKDAPGVRQLRWSTAPAHGTALLARDTDLIRSLVEWFQQTLAVS
jgi:dienelactone hydrolase